jgi:hypothetical protein
MNHLRIGTLLAAAGLAVGMTAIAVPVSAHPASDLSGKGTCDGDSVAKLAANARGDSIKVKAKVKTSTGGEDWVYLLADNGVNVIYGDATTAPNGKLRVQTSFPNSDGSDVIDFAAQNNVTSELCSAEVTVG